MEDEGPDLLAEAAWQVYGVPPAEFVAARTAWVKRLRGEGHRELAKSVGALRKPSVSAAAVNALVRADDPVAQRLRDVGGRLRHAQSALDAAGLTTLRGERDEVLAQWVEAARTHAPGGTLTAAVEGEVRATAVAALADASATEVVLSGTLTRALAYSGFGEVDLADAVARTSTGVVLTRIEGGRTDEDPGDDGVPDDGPGDVADAEPEGEEADDVVEAEYEAEVDDEHEGEDAVDDEHEAEDGVDDEHEAEDAVDEEALEQLREALAQAESEVSEARSRRRDAAGAEKRTSTGVTVAERGLEQARRLLEQAERHLADATRAQDAAAAELAEADAALTETRERRDAAREALEEAEDA